jgi:zinc D-Ala-D-Ala carboxypeptidase
MTEALTSHFTLAELSVTRHGDNAPPPVVVERLRAVTAPMLEQVRTLLGDRPIIVTSGYRSPAVNTAVGGVATSAHLTGYAADFICPAFGTPLEVCATISRSTLDFDQLIQEGTWVHLSVDPRMRREVLTRAGAGFSPGL